MLEQRATQRAFQRMNGTVHADVTGLQFLRRPRQIAGAHEGQEYFQFLERQFVIDLHVVALMVEVR